MPLNMNTIGTGSMINGSGSTETVINTSYSENLKSAVSDIGDCNISSSSIAASSYPLIASIDSPYMNDAGWAYGTVYFNGYYYGCSNNSQSKSTNYLYRYTIVRNSDGSCTRTATAITSLTSVTSFCRLGDRLICIGATTFNTYGKLDYFYSFNGTSFTKLSTSSVISMVGLPNPSANNAMGVFWTLFPMVNDDLSLSDMIFGHVRFAGQDSSYVYEIRAFFRFSESSGTIECVKSQYYDRYINNAASVIEQQMINAYDQAHGQSALHPIILPVGLDRFAKVQIKTADKSVLVSMFKWDWYVTTGRHDGSKDILTKIQETSISVPNIKTSNYTLSVEPLSCPEYDSYSILISYYKEESTYHTYGYVSEILFLNLLSSFTFNISRASLGFANKEITNTTEKQYIIRHHLNLYENKPWLMLICQRAGYGTMYIINVDLDGEMNTDGTRYTITGNFVTGDTIYSDDGIISVTYPDGTESSNITNVNKVSITTPGEYTFITHSSTAYTRPSFVVQTKSGSIMHLDIKQINDTDISGYFSKGMRINGTEITTSGYQVVQNVISNNRLMISL